MTAYENSATSDVVLTADQLRRLARHHYSSVGQSLLEPYMQVTMLCCWPHCVSGFTCLSVTVEQKFMYNTISELHSCWCIWHL